MVALDDQQLRYQSPRTKSPKKWKISSSIRYYRRLYRDFCSRPRGTDDQASSSGQRGAGEAGEAGEAGATNPKLLSPIFPIVTFECSRLLYRDTRCRLHKACCWMISGDMKRHGPAAIHDSGPLPVDRLSGKKRNHEWMMDVACIRALPFDRFDRFDRQASSGFLASLTWPSTTLSGLSKASNGTTGDLHGPNRKSYQTGSGKD